MKENGVRLAIVLALVPLTTGGTVNIIAQPEYDVSEDESFADDIDALLAAQDVILHAELEASAKENLLRVAAQESPDAHTLYLLAEVMVI